MTRIAIDAMGGDHAPFEIVAGAVWAAAEYGVALELVGKQDRIEHCLEVIQQEGFLSDCGKAGRKRRVRVDVKSLDIKVTHASEIIEMGEACLLYTSWGTPGASGSCGPCSEIHYDLGEQYKCSDNCGIDTCECDRWVEIWNLVFTELYQDEEGNQSPLEHKNVDTGMGLSLIHIFGVTTGTIMRKIREYGLQLPSEKHRELFYNEALPLLEQGVPCAKVRKLTGISEEYSRKWLKKNSYPSNKVLFDQHLEELYKQNYTDEQIADILYVEASTIARRRGDLGLKRKLGRPQSNIDWQEILEMLKNGKTAPQIVKEFKISAKLLAEKIKEISGVTPKKIELEYRKNFVANCLAKGDNISSIAEKLNLRREPLYKFIQKFLPEWVTSRKS